ncbi:ABC transporter ATP-binding protein [Aestuariispira insulae]|uniref:Amino acid/amide ABC transporter ATP-binding protein 1 (HAAT family) n=1 Tax=Aestuariispira insulae TaxID=1461337 RepID=A0A3D9HHZ3_9PROT|nr:ABC transporter ATP-binding protein [Aestuariispira insulae]RED49064.1 amino acid/amide ABC transporter ATP-binding protein 1 (HAAT family) [Aestuariispira insulae]
MTETLLEIKGLRKSFGALKATDDVNLDVQAGEIHALIGPNGAGKSTLIGQIAGGLKPDEGQIRFLNRDVIPLSVAKRARMGLGRSFQISSLAMEVSALKNVILAVQAREGSSFKFWKQVRSDQGLMDEAMIQLERVGLADSARTVTSELSHGQRRQLEVACALALKPKLLLLDEPMAGLGAGGSQRLTEFLESLKAEVGILLIEHDMDAVFQLADRISVLVYGRVIETGTVDQIRQSAQVREAYLGEEE